MIRSEQETRTNLAKAFNYRGSAYLRQGDYDHAIQDLDQGLRLNPSSVEMLYDRGLAYAHKEVITTKPIQDYNPSVATGSESGRCRLRSGFGIRAQG